MKNGEREREGRFQSTNEKLHALPWLGIVVEKSVTLLLFLFIVFETNLPKCGLHT
jgi:hypothetical protein